MRASVSGSMACAASHLGRAAVGSATSIISPWLPNSKAARLAGSTRAATPVAWLGSTITGKNVARILTRGEGLDAPFAQNDIHVALLGDVFGCTQPFDKAGGHSSFQQNRLTRPAHLGEQGVILHIARADLNHVRKFSHLFHKPRVHCFCDNGQAGFLPRGAQDAKSFDTQTLEVVG